MFRVDSDIDIAEDEPMPEFGTGHTMKIELDEATTMSNNAPDPHNDTGDSATLAGAQLRMRRIMGLRTVKVIWTLS